jgi:hypothetical protein
MARVYDIAVSALAVGVERKWLDNLTSQHPIPGTEHLARGVARRLAMRALVTAAIVRDLNRGLGVPVARAVELARKLLDDRRNDGTEGGLDATPGGDRQSADGPRQIEVSESLMLVVDVARIERDIERRLVEAMETVVPRRRGRPPLKERRGTR